MSDNPKPASPLPWRDATQIEKGGAGTVFGKRVVDTDGRGPVVEQRHMADWEHADQNRAYIICAANNAPAMAARIERLEAALREIGNNAPPRWAKIAREALEAE